MYKLLQDLIAVLKHIAITDFAFMLAIIIFSMVIIGIVFMFSTWLYYKPKDRRKYERIKL